MPVGHSLNSCTTQVDYAVIKSINPSLPGLEGCRVIMVDTPGFDDTYEGDIDILRRIAVWLEKSYRDPMVVLAGVIYLHDISHDRFSTTARKNLEIFNYLCRNAALSRVILGTTKWNRVTLGDGEGREVELKASHWQSMIAKGSEVRRFECNPESALEFINFTLRRVAMNSVLAIQQELVDEEKILAETNAGKVALIYTFQQMLETGKEMVALEAALAEVRDPEVRAKLDQARKRILALKKDMTALKIPLGRRISRFLGIS